MSKAAELAALIANVNNGSSLAAKNFIINGGMNVSQRGTSFSYAHDGTTAAYNLDRFYFIMRSHADEYDCTIAQVADSPDGFGNSLKITTGTDESAVGISCIFLTKSGIVPSSSFKDDAYFVKNLLY